MAGPILDLSDIQGDILRAYGNSYDRTSYLFVRIEDVARGRTWLRDLVDRVTTAEPWNGDKPNTTLNLALTAGGLEALGVSEAARATFSREFRAGMAARAEVLGDTGRSAPGSWDGGLGTGAAHVLATVNAQNSGQLENELRDFRARVEEASLTIVHEEHARLLPSAREHFGYADGFAQPAIEGSNEEKTAGGGVPEPNGRWRPLAPGEFILGYPDEDSRDDPRLLPSAPADPLGRSGTYMVWRKLYQDVLLYRRTLREAARQYEDGDEEMLAAKVVGRWRDGTPLVFSPDAPDPAFDASAPGANGFRYGDVDADGRRCPFGAHIRRSNPRDALGFDGQLSFRHRIIRRGMPYGPPLPLDATEDDGRDRGLVFVCFNASISRQFEGVQIQWLNDGNIFHLGHDKDFLLGDPAGTGKMTVQGDPPFFLAPAECFVTTRGGEYLFVPGINALGAIANGVAG
jgi:Dyp-type peroxidase family